MEYHWWVKWSLQKISQVWHGSHGPKSGKSRWHRGSFCLTHLPQEAACERNRMERIEWWDCCEFETRWLLGRRFFHQLKSLKKRGNLAGGFLNIFYFHPYFFVEMMDKIDEHIFSDGVGSTTNQETFDGKRWKRNWVVKDPLCRRIYILFQFTSLAKMGTAHSDIGGMVRATYRRVSEGASEVVVA